MIEMKPEDVMRALDKLKYGGHSCHDCKFAKWKGEDRCGLNGCRIAKAALALLHEKDAEIERLQEIADAVADSFPVCEGCKGKTELGERTEDCVYEIDGTFCAQRATKMWFALRAENEELHKQVERLKAKIEIDGLAYKDLQELYDADVKSLSDHIEALIKTLEVARAEAITEFAERMKKTITPLVNISTKERLDTLMLVLGFIDQIAEKMKGEENGESDL